MPEFDLSNFINLPDLSGISSNFSPDNSSFAHSSNSGTSSSSSSSSSFVNNTGAGASSSANVTSPTGNSSSNQTIFTPDATSSSASSTATVSTNNPPTTNTTVGTSTDTSNSTIIDIPSSPITASDTPVVNLFLFGTRGNDQLEGGDGNNKLLGGLGDDSLIGGNGDELLCGGFGTDVLTGGLGADLFVVRLSTITAASSPLLADTITDFNATQGDQIGLMGGFSVDDLVLSTFDSNNDGTLDATLVQLGSSIGDGIVAVVLNTVDGVGQTTLTNSDFLTVTSLHTQS